MHHFAASEPSVTTPNARVADAFSAMTNVTTVLASFRAAFPAAAAEARADSRPSRKEMAAAKSSDAAPQSVMPSDETRSRRQERILEADASLDAVAADNEATLRL